MPQDPQVARPTGSILLGTAAAGLAVFAAEITHIRPILLLLPIVAAAVFFLAYFMLNPFRRLPKGATDDLK